MEPATSINPSENYEPVEEFYAGKSVMITGGTGFLGKALIEKLVYSCPYLENVYVLVRDKKDVPGRDRFARILESKLFTRIRQEKPERLKKINFIKGDITLHDLGMSEDDKAIILDKVSIVFHSAATVRFDEPLKDAMKINVEGTRNIIHLSQKMKNLQAFLYMSTAFCITNKTIVEEVVYPPPMTIEDVYTFLELHGDADEVVKEIITEHNASEIYNRHNSIPHEPSPEAREVPRHITWTEDNLALPFEELDKKQKGINEISRIYGIPSRSLRRLYENIV